MSLQHRKDIRTTKTFAHNIKDYTNRENVWIGIYIAELQQQGKTVELKAHGVDNTGNLISGKLKNHNVDDLLMIDGAPQLVEVKTIPETSKFFTFKYNSLSNCVAQNACILVPRLTHYYILSVKAIIDILTYYEPQIYHAFSPNDYSIRLYASDMNEYIQEGLIIKQDWCTDCQILVEKDKNILFAKKAKNT
jgi:hypothetical protein